MLWFRSPSSCPIKCYLSPSISLQDLPCYHPHEQFVDDRNMKVKKPSPGKGHAKSQKWKNVKGKRCRPPITSSELNTSPVMAVMATEHKASVNKKPSVKRLKNKAKSVSESKISSSQSTFKKPHPEANGNSLFTMDESEDLDDWREYSQSIHENGMETSEEKEDVKPGRLEGESLHYCAERNHRNNQAVLVMQKDQVCSRMLSQTSPHQTWDSFNPLLRFSCRRCVLEGSALWPVFTAV